MNHRFYNIAWLLFNILLLSVLAPVGLISQIVVDAGSTAGVCDGSALELSDLNAHIMGDVTDGTWLSSGDGVFLPQNTGSGTFSISTQYVPGPLDAQLGTVTFTLASNQHPVTGIIETDQVSITVLDNVPLACNDFVSVGLNAECEVVITPQYLINNAANALNLYDFDLYTLDGLLIPTDTIGIQFLDQYINFNVEESCTGNVCWGQLLVMDNLAPQLICQDTIVSCLEDIIPDSLGFPVVHDSIIPGPSNSYILVNGDNCGDATATYEDLEIEQQCFEEYMLIIDRTWTVKDTSDNSAQCVQRIFIEKLDLFDVVFPENLDGNELPVLDCSVNYQLDSLGNPLPEYTGMPTTTGCIYLHATYDDINYSACGNTKKILRNWQVIEWCTSQIRSESQLIEIADTLAPEIECVELFEIAVNPYQCNISNESILIPSVVDNCSDWQMDASIRSNGIQLHYVSNVTTWLDLPDLEIGNYTIHWMAEDLCDNEAECITELAIVDQSVPFAICLDVSTVSVGSSGVGRLFPNSVDNGSFDNCTDLDFRLRKITDVCFSNTDFGYYIDFCCEEIGSTIMVELEVKDGNGLSNYCMAEILVEDKAAPELYCPSDLTVSCTYFSNIYDFDVFGEVHSDQNDVEDIIIFDSYNNGVAGTDGFYHDNCGATITSTDELELECSAGTLYRTFTATDGTNNVISCTQTITIINEGNFSVDDILWPADFDYVACDTAFLDPDISGKPTWPLEQCSSVASSYEDEVFVFSDNACVKIVRTWSVIDWCQYDENTGYGLWTEEQVIKINNLTAPEFLNCTDSLFHCITDDNCYQNFPFSINAFDDCTASDDLEFYFTLDLGANGSNDYSGFNSSFTYNLPIGIHKLSWRVEDRCGNPNFCDQIIEVTDCKNPTPYCLGSLTMVLDEKGTAEVWASEYNLGSTDNCTNSDDLEVSFSEHDFVSVLQFTCDDIPNGISETILLDVWYIDESGNAEFCTVDLILQDNISGQCPDNMPDDLIEGRIQDSRGDFVTDLTIDLDCEVASYSQSMVSPDGEFVFEGLSNDLYYSIFCEKEDTYLNGVTTLDLLLIQRHILGLTLLPTGYDVLAADVNLSGKVTGIDIVEMRKLILGINETLSITNDPWLFVRRDDVTADLNPWDLQENIDLNLTSETAEQEIVGIKYGDVNSSVSLQSDLETELRNQQISLEYLKYKEAGKWKYSFKMLEATDINAFQLSFNIISNNTDIQLFSSLNNFNQSNYYQNGGRVRVSWNTNQAKDEQTNGILFSFESDYDLELSLEEDFNNIIYTENSVQEIGRLFTKDTQETTSELHTYSVSNNQIVITSGGFSDSQILIEIYDLEGKRLWTKEFPVKQGDTNLIAHYTGIQSAALYPVKISTKTYSNTELLLLGSQ